MDNSAASSSHREIGIPAAQDPFAPGPSTIISDLENQNLPGIGSTPDQKAMYDAVIEGDLASTVALIIRDRALAWRELTEEGDRALHLAISKKHVELASEIVRWIGPQELELHDGHGYTACSYAAMEGNIELVRLMLEARPSLLHLRSWYETTPMALAVSYGHVELVSYFLSLDAITREERFDLMLLAIARKAFDVALKILEKNGCLAEMKGADDRTALHVLAQMDISKGWSLKEDEKTEDDLHLLAATLWQNIQYLGRDRVVEVIKTPPLLQDAVKVGNLRLVTMITRSYPQLLSQVFPDGYSLLHTIVLNRKENMLELVKKAGDAKDLYSIPLDKDGNNLLHSAGKAIYNVDELEIVCEQDAEMERAFSWFKEVEKIVPPIYHETRNKKGLTPKELFWKEHAALLARREEYMMRKSEACMFIGTVILTLVFGAAFAPPGGYNQSSGIPVFMGKAGFTSFIIFEFLAFSSSVIAILGFWYVSASQQMNHYRIFMMMKILKYSLRALLLAFVFSMCAFMSAVSLVFTLHSEGLYTFLIVPISIVLYTAILYWARKRRNRLLHCSLRERNIECRWGTFYFWKC